MHHRDTTIRIFIAAASAAIAACSSTNNSPTGTNSSAPPQATQTEVAAAVATGITAQVEALTTTSIDPFLVLADRVPTRKPLIDLSFLRTKTHFFPQTASCPTQTPTNPTDTDEDGVVDTVTDVFTTANCTEISDGDTISISGTLAIGDPTPTTADLNYNAGLTSFVVQEGGASGDVTVTVNGSVTVSETLSAITEAANYSLAGTSTPSGGSTSTATYTDNLTATYTFASPLSTPLVEGDLLPGGTLNLTGGETAMFNTKSYSYTISTPGGLTIDPSCATAVTAGTADITFSGVSKAAVITWTACGAYTVTYT
jgi:hypothetical protein